MVVNEQHPFSTMHRSTPSALRVGPLNEELSSPQLFIPLPQGSFIKQEAHVFYRLLYYRTPSRSEEWKLIKWCRTSP